MKIAHTLWLLLLLPILAFQCDDNTDTATCNEAETPVPFTPNFKNSDGYPLCQLQNIDFNLAEFNIIINSQEDFDKYVVCLDSVLTIDFTKSTVLAGMLATFNQDKVVTQTITRKCEEYFYYVEIGNGVGATPSHVSHFILIPKTSDKAKVFFDVNYIH